MEVTDFQAFTTDRNRSLSRLLYRYTQALFNQLAQYAACTTVHSVRIRCARWILMCDDRVGVNEFPLTHEFLAEMLGVRQASVTLVARSLHYTLTREEYDRQLFSRQHAHRTLPTIGYG